MTRLTDRVFSGPVSFARVSSGMRGALRRSSALLGVGRNAPVILMYHRVAHPPWDPWGLCVSPDNFRNQLAVLASERSILPMDELVSGLLRGKLPDKATALTFDDGYSDNFDVARPMLEEAGVPATMFLTTLNVETGDHFWWDELAAMVLGSAGAACFSFEAAGVTLSGNWMSQATLPNDLAHWRTSNPTDDPRRRSFVEIWKAMKEMTDTERRFALENLRRHLDDTTPIAADVTARPMTSEAARRLPGGVISLGAHGRTHAPLPLLEIENQRSQIFRGRADVADLDMGRRPSGFAYPHGDWTESTKKLVKAAGFDWAVATREAKVDRAGFDRYTLPRLGVRNTSGADLLQTIGQTTY